MARKGKPSDRLAVQDASKTLLANVRFAAIDGPIKTLTVTSTLPSEGKSTVAFNFSQAAATSGSRTIIVECDMRHRTVSGLVGVHGATGMYAVLSGRASLDDAIVPTQQKNLDFLDVEPGIPNPPDVLSSRRFRRLLQDLRQEYDYVVFDTPPVGAFVDAAVLASLTDGTLFVVRENYTKREMAADALEQLRKGGANVLGTVLNFCDRSTSGSYYYDYAQSVVGQADESLPELPRESHAHMASSPHADHEAAPAPSPTPRGATDRKVSPSETAAFVMAAEASRASAPRPASGAAAASDQPARPAPHTSVPVMSEHPAVAPQGAPLAHGTGATASRRFYQPQANPYVRHR